MTARRTIRLNGCAVRQKTQNKEERLESDTMTRREREDLARLARKRERLLKTAAKERKAVLLADFESQMATIHHYDTDATWKAATEAAEEAVEVARSVIDQRCEELGIPRPFRPRISFGWYGRGENALAERRAELRRVAVTRLDALESGARTEIERTSLEIQTKLIAGGLTSDAAREFLAGMPSVEALMPVLDTSEIRGLIQNSRRSV